MAIDLSGLDGLPKEGIIQVTIEESNSLVRLAKALPWQSLCELVVEDLKKTAAKGMWQKGRKIVVRNQLAVYLLQRLYNIPDRKIEQGIKDNAAYQVFCGKQFLQNWHVPDHTKIETFRNRLSGETQRALANHLAKNAVTLGFADPTEVDFDSTVQEANISYPSDASLMTKLVGLGKKVADYVREELKVPYAKSVKVDIKSIMKSARSYFFLAKNKGKELKQELFAILHKQVKRQIKPVLELCKKLSASKVAKLPWNVKRAFETIHTSSWRYLLDVAHFTRTQSVKAGKLMSFHAKQVSCISKGKIGKAYEFGRVFQLARIKGNFMYVLESTSVLMNDKHSFKPLLQEHQTLFGKGSLQYVAADKGYYTSKNKKTLIDLGISSVGLAKPGKCAKGKIDQDLKERLHNRRAGIEPLIGHIKRGGQLGKSRMKKDATTLAAGYGSVCGFNLRQLARYLTGSVKMAA